MVNFSRHPKRCFLILAALFLYFENSNSQPGYSSMLSSKIIGDDVALSTPANNKIVFYKTVKNGKPVFTMQLQAFGSLTDAGKGIHIIFANGQEIYNPDVPVEVGIPDSYKVAFKYTGRLILDDSQIQYLRSLPVKEYQIGNIRSTLSKKEQSMFLNYFQYLLMPSNPENLIVGKSQSW